MACNGVNGVLKKPSEGFTLIEMVIVVLLVGIMAAIAIPKFLDLTGTARQATYDAGMGALKSSVGIYLGKNDGEWPDGNSLAASMEGVVTCTNNDGALDGVVESIVIADIDGAYTLTTGSCETALTSLDQISNYASNVF